MNNISIYNIKRFTSQCFDKDNEKASRIIKGILDAKSPRISDIANAMNGNPDANYKTIQRFIKDNEPKEALNRLYNENAPFVIGDPTDIERLQAKKTEYVGKTKDKRLGFQIFPLSFPYEGRAIPFTFITYSSKTINDEVTSRNLQHHRVIRELKELLGDKPLVLDREFSYEWILEEMVTANINFVIRLNVGNKPTILDEEGNKVSLLLTPGEEIYYRGVYYKGTIKVNIAGIWEKGFSEPVWVMSILDPKDALGIYFGRMKIDESFRDMKSLLNLEKIMNKKQRNMEKMVGLVLLAYSIGLLIGEGIRDRIYPSGSRKRKQYSGLFILLKQSIRISRKVLRDIINCAYELFTKIVLGGFVNNPVNVRTHV